jgi:tetratricopeptide (TPR) repeat protein
MNKAKFRQAFDKARNLQARGQLREADLAYRGLLSNRPEDEIVLKAMVELYGQVNFLDGIRGSLQRLIMTCPDQREYYEQLSRFHDQQGQSDAAIDALRRYLARHPEHADTQFNLALLLRKSGRLEAALKAYEDALRNGISAAEDIYLNMSVLLSELHREEQAATALRDALALKPDLVPAMFNLAALTEESGDIDAARTLYQRVLELEPDYLEALARLAGLTMVSDAKDPVIEQLRCALAKPGLDANLQIDLNFALGKVLDDCGQYDLAFKAYSDANDADKKRGSGYDRAAHEAFVEANIAQFTADWFAKLKPTSGAAPIFICGMFRSGSTLVEQILASHHDVIAGGELAFFDHWTAQQGGNYVTNVSAMDQAAIDALASQYIDELGKRFPDAGHVTDKRPDNFLYLGLIRSLFPNARIINSTRGAIDNCLSVYFVRLGQVMSYARDLGDIAHYYRQYQVLMTHWKSVFGDQVFEVNYDTLVADPEPVVRELLEFCELEWDENCLSFHELDNYVKTASAWQVRQPLHTNSSGRAGHYTSHLEALTQGLDEESPPPGARPVP